MFVHSFMSPELSYTTLRWDIQHARHSFDKHNVPEHNTLHEISIAWNDVRSSAKSSAALTLSSNGAWRWRTMIKKERGLHTRVPLDIGSILRERTTDTVLPLGCSVPCCNILFLKHKLHRCSCHGTEPPSGKSRVRYGGFYGAFGCLQRVHI